MQMYRLPVHSSASPSKVARSSQSPPRLGGRRWRSGRRRGLAPGRAGVQLVPRHALSVAATVSTLRVEFPRSPLPAAAPTPSAADAPDRGAALAASASAVSPLGTRETPDLASP